MHRLYIFIAFVCLPILVSAQTLRGKVYDSTSTAKSVKVFNDTQNRITATNDIGEFTIVAKVNDTILFESVFYHPKVVILKPYHFEDIAVFELKKVVNTLDEVEIIAEPEQPVFELETYNSELQNLIKEDIKNNPQLYAPSTSNYGVDFVYLFRKLFSLIKKKKKKPEEIAITYNQLKKLIDNDTFFNSDLLTKDLKIPNDRVYLFLEFCSAKQINPVLLQREKKMQLLEELVLSSQLFLILLEEYDEDSIIKD